LWQLNSIGLVLVPFVLQSFWKRLRLLSKWKKFFISYVTTLGLNCGRWDYTSFSFIKKVQDAPRQDCSRPFSSNVSTPLMETYVKRDLHCHKRGTFAMGGMAASILSSDPKANAAAMAKVEEDK
jgi:malate synthase